MSLYLENSFLALQISNFFPFRLFFPSFLISGIFCLPFPSTGGFSVPQACIFEPPVVLVWFLVAWDRRVESWTRKMEKRGTEW